MDYSCFSVATVCLLVGLAAFIDSIAGGGGLISLPAFLLVGLPAQVAAGSNKFSAGIGASMAICRFAKSGKINWMQALTGMVAALVGSAIGTSCAVWMSEQLLKTVIVCALPLVAVYLLFKGIPKDNLQEETPLSLRRNIVISALIGLVFGAYDGLIGPGTGTFIILASIALLHLNMVTASANAKVINFASNMASLAVYAWHGDIAYRFALPAAAFAVMGNFLGVKYCLKYGSKGIRKILFVVLALLFSKLLYDVIIYMEHHQ